MGDDRNPLSKIKTISPVLWDICNTKNSISRKTYVKMNEEEYNNIIKHYSNFIKNSYEKLMEHYDIGVKYLRAFPGEEKEYCLDLLEIVKGECILEIEKIKKEIESLVNTKSIDNMFEKD